MRNKLLVSLVVVVAPLGLAILHATVQAPECQIQSKTIWKSGPREGLSWSQKAGRNRVAYAQPDVNGWSQVYIADPTVGGVTNQVCLTCTQQAGGPIVNTHHGIPEFLPADDLIAMTVEEPGNGLPASVVTPGAGRASNVWITDLTGTNWWKITNYPAATGGVLFPIPNPAQNRLVWSERYANATQDVFDALSQRGIYQPAVFGSWRLNIGVLSVTGGVPSVTSITPFTLGGAVFYEPEIWDGNTNLIYAAKPNNSPNLLDLFENSTTTGALVTRLTDSNHWDEQITLSPTGHKVVYMSSRCCSYNPGDTNTLRTELYMADWPSMANEQQLTYFNSPWDSQYDPAYTSVATKAVWGPSATNANTMLLTRAKYLIADHTQKLTEIWQLTFAGSCGAL